MKKKGLRGFAALVFCFAILMLSACDGKSQAPEERPGIEGSQGIANSQGVNSSQDITGSQGIESPQGIEGTQNIASSQDIESAQEHFAASGTKPEQEHVAEVGESSSAPVQTPAQQKPPIIKVEEVSDDTYSDINLSVIYSRVSVEGDGYENLAEAFTYINSGLAEYVLACAEEYAEDLYMIWDTLDEERKAASSSFEEIITVERADAQIVSLAENQFLYLDGMVHPVFSTESINLNAQTGNLLNLDQIFEDDEEYNDLYEAVCREVANMAAEQGLYEDYEETISRYFFAEEEYELTWFYREDTISFVFSPYVLGPYAVGPVYVDIPLEGYKLAALDTAASDTAD